MNQISNPSPKLGKKEAIVELWRRANLSWKLKSNQKELYDLFYNSPHRVQTWLLSRRSGKTYSLALLAIEACIKTPNTIVKFVAPTKLQVDNILRPIMRTILEDCPEEITPDYSKKDYIYYFKNGSEIQLAGSEGGHAEKLRGSSSNISIVDEAQDVTDLNYIIKSILLPTTLTTNGKIILSGTPPKDMTHDFIDFIEEAESRNTLIKKTIYDNPMLSLEVIEDFALECGGKESETFRREGMCELIKETSTSVLPEFNAELEKEIVREWDKPGFFKTFEAMDLGFKDLTGVLFAYYDFKANKIIIEDEITLKGKEVKLPELAAAIKLKEEQLWTNIYTNEINRPTLRVSDINHIVTSEISRFSDGLINFTPARKDDRQAAINNLRVLLKDQRIIINPRCKVLIRHLRNVKWDRSRNPSSAIFARSVDDSHYDLVDCLLYLTRHIDFTKNPYPAGHGMDMKNVYVNNPDKFYSKNNNQIEVFKKVFKVGKRKY